jgi:hypothetical protein
MKNKHAVALGSIGGSVTSEAKAAASRENGKKGGRRPSLTPGDKRILLYALGRAKDYVASLEDAACRDARLVKECERELRQFERVAAKLR